MKVLSRAMVSFLVSLLLAGSVCAEVKSKDMELYEAAVFQDLLKMQSLIAEGANVNYIQGGRPILGWAAQNGNVAVVEALLKAGANPNVADIGVGHTPLMRAIETQFIEIVRVLLKSKADPNAKNSEGESCLIMAVESRKPEIVQAIIDGGADVQFVTEDGNSPALVAAQDGMPESFEIIKILGKAKANMNVSNLVYTPLVYAVQQGNKELVQTLLDAGADANAKTQSGQLPLQHALDNSEILQLLLKAKANPDTTNSSGDTPLIAAVRNGNIEAVKILLAAGANTELPDSSGNMPLQVAEQNYQTEITELLKKQVPAETEKPLDLAHQVYPVEPEGTECTMVKAAKKQMELHGKLQAKVNAGTMSSEIFRTFGEDTKGYADMLANDLPEACKLFERLAVKYGVE